MKRKTKSYQKIPGRTSIKLLALLAFLIFPLVLSNAQDKIIVTGTVTDAENNEALPGVSITEAGTTTGTISDIDGNYSLRVDSDAVLHFSFVGYLSQDIPVDNRTEISTSLEIDAIGLEEVIVTGYGVQRKSDVTGSIASVSSEKLNEIPISEVDQALQGLAAGVNIIPVSGRPGEPAVIQIRGISSINGIDPLVIVDGVPGSLTGIAPSEIESIEVLKDASSAAIYGDSGGNGVIIVTTKNGSPGKMKTNINVYQGIETAVGRLELMNSQQWLSTLEETYPGDIAITSQPDTMPTYDWQNIIFQPAFTQNYDVTSSGGTEVSTYMVSASYNKQNGIIRSSDYDRFTLRINSEHKISKRITFDEKINFLTRNRYGLEDWRWNAYYDGPVRPALLMQPNVPDYNPDGTWANSDFGGSNPLAALDMIDRVAKTNNFNGNFGLKVDLIKGLSFTSRFAGSLGFWDNKDFQNSYFNTVTDLRNDNETKIIANIGRSFSYTAQQLLNYNTTIAQDHNISILAGLEAVRNWGYDYGGQRLMMPNIPANLQYFQQSVNDTTISQIIEGGGYETRGLAYIGRVNYDYKGKYLLTANIRRSGRSTFGPDYRFGIFPSVSVGWKFSEESFMDNQNLISFGKVRFGYGEVGTFARSGNPYLSIVRSPQTFGYPFNNVNSSPGAAPVQLANSEIHWETIHMSNIGIDLGMFQNRLSLTAEYYSKVNEDMLMLQEVTFVAGTYTLGSTWDIDDTSPEVNIGSIRNSGLEFTLGYKDQAGDFKYNFDLNLSTLKNEVLSLASDSLYGGSVHNIDPITITRVGGSISEFYGFQTDGLFSREDCAVDADGNYILNHRGEYTVVNQPFFIKDDGGDTIYAQPNAQPGDVRYKDLDGDGRVLQEEDKTSLGSPIPKLIFGFALNMEYKGLDLSAQFTGTLGNKIFNGTKQYLYYHQGYGNHAVDFENRYIDQDVYKNDPITGDPVLVIPENIDTDVPRNASANYTKPSEFYIEDGSYLRLRNLTLGYTLPTTLTRTVNIERLRVYVGARNLVTWTAYSGINPEIGQGGILDMGIDASIYPVTRMLFWGVNLTF